MACGVRSSSRARNGLDARSTDACAGRGGPALPRTNTSKVPVSGTAPAPFSSQAGAFLCDLSADTSRSQPSAPSAIWRELSVGDAGGATGTATARGIGSSLFSGVELLRSRSSSSSRVATRYAVDATRNATFAQSAQLCWPIVKHNH